jgi:hypothetical protein
VTFRKKIEAKLDKSKAEVDCIEEKLHAEVDSDGMNKELKHVKSEAKKSIRIAKADLKEILN